MLSAYRIFIGAFEETAMMIDLHTHVFPDAIAPAAMEKLQAASHIHPFTDGTAAMLRASMAKAGIGRSVVLPVATSPRQVPHINDAALRLHASAAETGVDSFGGLHPRYDKPEEEMDRLLAAGIRGIKVHPPYQGADLDDPAFLRILRGAAERDLAVLTHAGLDVGLPGARQATPEKILRALEKTPGVTLILAHMGGWRCWEEAERLLSRCPVYLDTSFALGAMTPNGDGYYQSEAELQMLSPGAFADIARSFGADRVLFGTDSPWSDQAACRAAVEALPLTAEEKRLILGENAERLLRISM